MLPPHELKNKNFSRVLRGYNSVEVDEHINFIIEKYTELYRQNDELERKLKLAEAQLAEFRADEESIRSALVNAQKASAKIISEANDRADIILRSARNNCNKIIASFRGELQKQRQELLELRRAVAEFKTRLFEQYQQHITYIEQISPDDEDMELDFDTPDEVYVRRVVEHVKEDIASGNIPVEPPEIGVNTERQDEPIIAVESPDDKTEQMQQPSIREITRPQSAWEQRDENEKPATGQANYEHAEDMAPTADTEILPGDAGGDGGRHPVDAATETDLPETPRQGDKAEDEPQTSGITDAASEPLPIDIIKPDDKPSTIAAEGIRSADKRDANDSGGGQSSSAQGSYRSASVKDTIRELNKKFSAGEPGESQTGQDEKPADEPVPDAEDEELLSLIRRVSNAAEEKDREYKQSKKKYKNKKKPLSLTEEFDLISEDENTSNDK
ncbi:MAG: DivIVA domain-containing protein [Eubacteriales bacterium]|jgi:cell division septum initiation protein DivIVA